MKILIALYELENFFGGVQTWAKGMYFALRKMGHDVHFLTHCPGYNPSDSDFDLILCNSNVALHDTRRFKGVKIFISHGILPQLEQPVKGADIYVAVSEEVADNCKAQGFPVDRVIRNPIDLDEFPFSGCSEELKTIAFFDRRRKFKFKSGLVERGFRVIEIGNPPVVYVWRYLEEADLVVARGRGAYEAMAMGKNVIVSGNNSGRSKSELMDGFVDDETFFKFRQNNLSGRHKHIEVKSIDVFLKETEKYNQNQGVLNRNLIAENNNSKMIANQFLELVNQK